MSLFEIFLRFIYVGLFTVGGGLASIPLILQMIVAPGLITEEIFYNMLAISESTPGPIGVNIATYIGFTQYGVLGGIVTTLGMALPCFTISFLISRGFQKFSGSGVVKAAFYGIRAAVTGLIATATYSVMRLSILTWESYLSTNSLADIINWKALVIFAVIYFLIIKLKKHPVIYIAIGGLAGFFLL